MIPGYKKFSGSVLLSHPVSQAVPSAQKSLTSVFEMGTGVSSLPLPPKKRLSFFSAIRIWVQAHKNVRAIVQIILWPSLTTN
jgi:hypothetical protein